MSEPKVPRISLVVPCFNEEQALPITVDRLAAELTRLHALGLIDSGSCIYLVDDGSSDCTWSLICEFAASDKPVAGIKLSRNHGHQYALYAGLMEADGDVLISLDADLQDDIAAIEDMLRLFLAGKQVVYGVRDDRSSDSLFKRLSARGHYWLSRKLGIEAVRDSRRFSPYESSLG